MVFRRENKVDAFQRQMNALRHQIGGDVDQNTQEQDVENLPDEPYDDQFEDADQYGRQDAGGYSFGSYPAADQARDAYDEETPEVPQIPASDSSVTVVAAEARWKGDLSSDGSIHLFGSVEGTVTSKEDIWVAEGADVDASVTAKRVIVAGKVSGTVRALSRFEALQQGVVDADVHAPSFVVHEGATINGKLAMSGNDQPVTSGRAERSGSSTILSRRARS